MTSDSSDALNGEFDKRGCDKFNAFFIVIDL
jgi:hypothetical protein